ncbi:host specificity factor TipJ family phage tail protein [Kushneria konosiri]|uniref:Tip attachment protein J HDII-ins2 domain-containing protein n=1 Tax=Kushneria konosiri TaxID=698828 RepID=A0A2Z2H2W6_9GAMM|nr:host specificity factor TipJ family phage tail protein [Kushneria konosiri]ARS51495.1 hypothetical protein B9G99_00090 [Kushneria konosiri]
MIEIYPSSLEGRPAETHYADDVTLEQWLLAEVHGYEEGRDRFLAAGQQPPISITLNGCLIPPMAWEHTRITGDDCVKIVIEPKGGAFEAIGSIISGVINSVFKLFVNTPSIGGNDYNSPGKGQELYGANAKGNKPKLGAVLPEIAGRMRRYPDYLNPPRRWFESKREQRTEMLLCFGKGQHLIDPEDLYVGDTPIISLGSGGEYQIFGPGEFIDHPARIHWHDAPEVGGTSTGTAGVELATTYSVSRNPSASAYVLSGSLVTIPNDAGSFPDGWQSGMIAIIRVPQDVIVIDGGDAADIIEGDFTALDPYEGMPVELAGDNAGTYVVASYSHEDGQPGRITLNNTKGQPARYLANGSKRSAFGFPGFKYSIVSASSQQITVSRLNDAGESDQDWPGFDAQTSRDTTVVLDASTVEGDWAGAFVASPYGAKTNAIEWDVMFPGGLAEIDDDGDLREYSVQVEIQWRDIADRGAWTSIKRTFRDTTLDQLGFTQRINLPYAMRPEVRMRRIGEKSTDTQIQDDVQWYGLRSRIESPDRYEGVTTIAITLKGGQKLASQSENLISAIGTRVLPVRRNGVWQAAEPTRDIAPFVAYILKSRGYTDPEIDLDALDRLDVLWRQRGDTLDCTIEDETTVKEALKLALTPGYADFTIQHGQVLPVRDGPREVWDHQYSPQNMTGPLTRQYSAPSDDDHDSVEVEFTSAITWQKTTVMCALPGSEKRKTKKLKVEGITDETRAWRLGMRELMRIKYQRFQYSWETEMDALNSRYLSYCPVSDDVPGYSQSALVLDWSREDDGRMRLMLTEPLRWQEGEAHVVSLRRSDGTTAGPLKAEQTDDPHMLLCANPKFDPVTIEDQMEPTIVQFGTLETWSFPVLVMSASPSGMDSVKVDGVNYAPEVYAYDDAEPPATA